MKKFDSEVLVIDVESTCWELPEKPAPGEFSEIIEVGLALVDTKKLVILDNASIIVKPSSSRISKFCTKLTSLTQEIVDEGISLEEACKTLQSKYKSSSKTFISWGDYDRKMFEKNCSDYRIKYPFGPRHMNLKNNFTILHGLDREPGMDEALKYLELPLEGTHHRGVDDARNIASILLNTLERFRDSAQLNQ